MAGVVREAARVAWQQADGFIKGRLLLTLLLVFTSAAFSAVAPLALKYAVDALGARQPKNTALEFLSFWGMDAAGGTAFGPITLISAYLVSLWVSRSLGELRWFLYGTADQRLARNLSRRLFGHVLELPLSFHLGRKTGALSQTLIQGLSGYSILLNHTIFILLPVAVEIAVIGAVLTMFLNAQFLAILGASVIAYSISFALGVKQIIGPSRAVSTAQVDAYASLTDSILNAEMVKYFTAEQRVGNRYDTALAKTETQWASFYRYKTMNGLLIALVFVLSLGAASLLAAKQVVTGAMTLGDFVLVNAYMLQIVKPMETLGAAFRDLAYGVAFIEKMTALMTLRTENTGMPAPAAGKAIGAGTGGLIFNDVTFSYLEGDPVLRGVSFTVPPGKTLGIVGGSGAGKSSLVRLLLRLYDPDSGDILFGGRSIQTVPLDALRRAIAVVPQDTVLFNDTIAYNIGLGRPDCTQGDIERAARLAHIHDTILAMPDGYRTIVGERGLKLSGGEKQRVSIARAVLKKPHMFVFDEATSSLDTKTERQILDNLLEVSKGVTTLIIAHRLSTVVHADEILVLDEGRVVERGPHGALLGKNGFYASMWQIQQRGSSQGVGSGETS